MRYLKKLFSTLLLLSLCSCALAQKSEQSGWYVKGYTEETAKSYFDRRYSLDLIEGIWQSNDIHLFTFLNCAGFYLFLALDNGIPDPIKQVTVCRRI